MENLDKSLRVLQYYHTTIRNMALYASVAFAALVYSRFHRGKNFGINIILICTSLVFTILSIIIGYYLKEDLKNIEKIDKGYVTLMEKWLLVPNVLIGTNYVILLATVFVLFLQFR
jgi:hypothetical protein